MLIGFVADRAVLRLSGEEAASFLQDLVTNDVTQASKERAVYAALLTPQGKYLFDFFVLRDGEDVLLDVADDRADGLMQRLTLYRLRRKIGIERTSLRVALVWAEGEAPGDAPGGVPDPRDPALGWRLYAEDADGALAALRAASGSAAGYAALRVALGVPETGVELGEDTYILEAGFERLNGVDFRKGCFVGQEVVARMKHKAELRKGLVQVDVEGQAPPPGTALTTEQGKPAGALFTVAEGRGLAHLRFDRADGPLHADGVVVRRAV